MIEQAIIGGAVAGGAAGGSLVTLLFQWLKKDVDKNTSRIEKLEEHTNKALNGLENKVLALINYQIMRAESSGEAKRAVAVLKCAASDSDT